MADGELMEGVSPADVAPLLRSLLTIALEKLDGEDFHMAVYTVNVAGGMLMENAPAVVAHECYEEDAS